MNIFLVDPDPRICAEALDDVRLNKMLVETGQLLSTAYRRLFTTTDQRILDTLYKETHANHPCSVWARKNIYNYSWLLEYFHALHREYYHRKNTTHLTWRRLHKVLEEAIEGIDLNPEANPVEFTFDCSSVFDDKLTIFSKYKECLRNKWLHDLRTPRWRNREKPEWF